MNFLYTSFLYVLGILAIPIIIHLFYFRRFKTVYFSNVSFLKTLKEETSARSKVKNIITLLLRMLALAALIFAFAQPFLKGNNAEDLKQKGISVFVDNSFSMQAKDGEASLFEVAKSKAREIVEAYDVTNKFHVFSHEMLPQNQRLVSKDEALTIIESLSLTPNVLDGQKVVDKQKRMLRGDFTPKSYIISDFQKSIFEEQIFKDTTFKTTLIYVKAIGESNLSIDSCWFESPIIPNQPNKLIARFHNYSNEAQEINPKLTYNGQNLPMGTKKVDALSSVQDTISMNVSKDGWQSAVLNISDFPVSFDDDYYFAFPVSAKVNILAINGGGVNKFMNAAFQKSEYTDLTNVSSTKVQFSTFETKDLIILNGLTNLSSGLISSLEKYASLGGNVMFFPSSNGNIGDYNKLMTALKADRIDQFVSEINTVSQLNTQAFILRDVYKGNLRNINLPTTKKNLTFTKRALSHTEYLMKYKNGDNFISRYKYNRGQLIVCATPLDKEVNDLVKNAEIFVPLIYRTAISNGAQQKLSYTIGSDEGINLPSNSTSEGQDIVYKISNDKEYAFIPRIQNRNGQTTLFSGAQVVDPGYYDVKLGENLVSRIAYNYSRLESEMDFYSKADLTELSDGRLNIIDDLQSNSLADIITSERDNALWRWLLIAGLIFLLLETLVLRFWKTDSYK